MFTRYSRFRGNDEKCKSIINKKRKQSFFRAFRVFRSYYFSLLFLFIFFLFGTFLVVFSFAFYFSQAVSNTQ